MIHKSVSDIIITEKKLEGLVKVKESILSAITDGEACELPEAWSDEILFNHFS